MKKTLLSLVVASAVGVTANATMAEDELLVTRTSLGLMITDGNTNTKTLSLDAKAKKGWGKHIANFMIDGQYASDKDKETKNKFFTELTYDYQFIERFSFNYLAGFRKDKFSGFASQIYTGPGGKYKAIISDIHNLSVDGNLLYAVDDYDAVYTQGIGGPVINYPKSTAGGVFQRAAYEDTYAAYRVKGVYDWQILENLKFDQELSFRGSFKNFDKFYVYSKSELSSKISDMFSAGVSLKVDYVNVPANGKDSTDRTFTANLIMDY